MIAIALGTLAVTAAVTAGLARRTAVDAARSTLADHTPVVANELNQLIALLPAARKADNTAAGRRQIRRTRSLVQTTLSVSDGAIVAIDADGNVRDFLGNLLGGAEGNVVLPNGVTADDLDVTALQAGDTQKGRDGSTVFQAEPLTKVNGLTPVVVLAEQVNSRPFGNSSGLVLGAALLALGVAALIAAYLARRMTRPSRRWRPRPEGSRRATCRRGSTPSTSPTTSWGAWPRRSMRWRRGSTPRAATSARFS